MAVCWDTDRYCHNVDNSSDPLYHCRGDARNEKQGRNLFQLYGFLRARMPIFTIPHHEYSYPRSRNTREKVKVGLSITQHGKRPPTPVRSLLLLVIIIVLIGVQGQFDLLCYFMRGVIL
jgi:hypothetical protein